MKKNILIVFGTRPETIKLLPLIKILKDSDKINAILCVTNQHAENVRVLLCSENIRADYEIPLRKEGRDLFDTTVVLMEKLRDVIISIAPELVVVHGDTTTAYTAALSAFYLKIPVAHIEAGLRSDDLTSPFPEEFNRRSISMIAKYHFAPTVRAFERLVAELGTDSGVYLVGNTVVDALRQHIEIEFSHSWLNENANRIKIVLTLHRRENLAHLRIILSAIRKVIECRDDVALLYPVHLNPETKLIANEILDGAKNIFLSPPIPYTDFINILSCADLVLTDSGGIQEEAGALGIPTLVLRNVTERQELILSGTGKLIGTDPAVISSQLRSILDNNNEYEKMAIKVPDFGDGAASKKIADILNLILE